MPTREKKLCFVCRAPNIKLVRKGKRILFQCLSCNKFSERYFCQGGKTKVKKTGRGLMHFSAGALIEQNGKYLVSKRTFYPFLYTLIGGHVDKGETMGKALVREVREETGLKVLEKRLIYKGVISYDPCSRGVNVHFWNLFLVKPKGKLRVNYQESVHLSWLTRRQMRRLHFTPPITYIFHKLKFFKKI